MAKHFEHTLFFDTFVSSTKKQDIMKISIYTLTSSIHDAKVIERSTKTFLEGISIAADCEFEIKGEDFSDYNDADMPVIFVRTGGTEGKFKKVFPQIKGYVRLLTSGMSNSLAASMEILSFLRNNGRKGEILHGSSMYIAQHLTTDYRVEQARKKLNGSRYGVIGAPSDWLIASDADRDVVRNKLGIELVDITIDELLRCYDGIDTASEAWHKVTDSDVYRQFASTAPQMLMKYRDGAFRLYAALQQIVDKYQLSGFTIRCFDLLTAVKNTGCMALALFNSRGIIASCEGDVPAMLTMAVGQALTGSTGFQANPSRIDVDKEEITFAHCTVPMNMVKSYTYDTHFESGIGIGIKGEFEKGIVTIAKISGDLSRSWFCIATLTDNLSERNLCRTQIVLRGNSFADYFLTQPIGNHHIIFNGDVKLLFDVFMKRIG